ncbi:MAG: type III-B CRISPR module RAMP protein Cmr6 [Ardenticatenales bacterium]|nr:type III-B CRISPR module RAMP protein Cmr6 [Ardenticatenales bacterium]
MSHFPFPPTTARLIQQERSRVENLGLLLDRYVPWGQGWAMGGKEKREILDEVVRRAESNAIQRLAGAHADRWSQRAEMLVDAHLFEANPEWRLVVGLGGTSVLETAMTLHRIYGLPLIPGSAIKGMARAYAELVGDEDTSQIETVFGPPPGSKEKKLRAGEVIFLDAVPLPPLCLEVDVMNPHYGEWYLKKHPAPGDYLSPVPVAFLTVARGTRFRFAVAARRSGQGEQVEKAAEWVKKGLEEMGIGAKTAAGYGFFQGSQ